jgi:uncharacterized protein YdeI (YjbR/CyaY-like superfamily)
MPPDVAEALGKAGVGAAYAARPDYQRNDYLRWISQAATEETRRKRIEQMLRELRSGGVYMGMAHRPSAKA